MPRSEWAIAILVVCVLVAVCYVVDGCGPSPDDSAQGVSSAADSTQEDAPSAAVRDGGEDEVHATRTGQRYHRAGCRSLSKSDIPMTRAEAEAKGLTPCKVCKP